VHEISLKTERKTQLIEITDLVRDALGGTNGASAALVYVPHTTAGVAITERIDPEHVIRTIDYAHPVFTEDGVRAQARHAEINGVNRTRFAGAYWGWGFHEDGVVSGLQAVAGMRATAAPEPVAA